MRISLSQASRGTALEFARREYARIEVAATLARNTADSYLLNALRAQMSLTLSPRVANTWRRYRYPPSGKSANAASSIVSKVPWMVEAFAKPAVIMPKKGKFLAIPTPNAPPRGSDNKRITPSNWPTERMGPLRLVRTKRGKMMLIAEQQKASFYRRTGKFRRFNRAGIRARAQAEKQGEAFQSVIMFHLIKVARLKRRLDPISLYQRAIQVLAITFETYMTRRPE